MKKTLMVASIMLLAASMSYAQSNTATSTLSVTVGTEAAITATGGALTEGTGIFANYTGTTALNYQVRTVAASGKITVEITTDFSTGGTGGGPSVAHPPTAGDTLSFTCTASSPTAGAGSASACNSSQTVTALNTAYPVATFAAGTQSDKSGDPASTTWTLINDPAYLAGSYNAVATYTISAS